MSPEMIAILAVGVALAGLMLRSQYGLGLRIDEVNNSLSKRIDEVNNSLSKRIDEVNSSLGKRIDEVNSSLGKRIDEVNSSLGKRIDEVNSSLGKRIDEVNKRIDGLEVRMSSFDERLRALEIAQAELKGTILGKLDFIERYIIARNLQASEASAEQNETPAA